MATTQKTRDRSASKKLKQKTNQAKRTPLMLLGGGSILGLILIVVLATLGSGDKQNGADSSSRQVAGTISGSNSGLPLTDKPPSNVPTTPQSPETNPSTGPVSDEPPISETVPSETGPSASPDSEADDPNDSVATKPTVEMELPPFGTKPPFGTSPDDPSDPDGPSDPVEPATPSVPTPTDPNPATEPKPTDTPNPFDVPDTTDPKPPTPDTKPTPPDPTPKPAPPPGQPSDVQIAELANALQAARKALGEYRFADAKAELEKARALPMLPDHMAKFERLDLTSQYAENFRAALKQAVAMLDGGDDIEVGSSTVVGVVDKTADSITIRLAGMNRTYKFDDLPEGLAIGIADKSLDQNDPVTLVMKAAFLATLANPRPDRLDRARQWFQEAKAKDPEIGDLEAVIDDIYEFKSSGTE